MKIQTQLKQGKALISTDRIEIYVLALVNLFLILAISIGGNGFFHSAFVSIGLITNITAFSIIFFTNTPSFKKISKKEIPILTILAMEIILLLGIPLLPLIKGPLFLQFLIVASMQLSVSFFFWKIYEREVSELSRFFIFNISLLYEYVSPRLVYTHFIPHISRLKLFIILKLEKFQQLLVYMTNGIWTRISHILPEWLFLKKQQTRSVR